MDILVDTSVWVDYFRGGRKSTDLDTLIDENIVVTNDIILAELLPYLKVKKQVDVVNLLQEINRVSMQINWGELIAFQVSCLRAGVNGVGLPDLMIAQNAKANRCKVYTLDKHFFGLHRVVKVDLYR